MSTVTYGFYSTAGEELARRLVSGVCADVEADAVTRRKALDRLADALDRVSDLDGGASDPDPVAAIAEHVSRSFALAGYTPVSGEEISAHFDAWRRTGAPVSGTAVPPAVELAADAAREASAAAAALASRGDVAVATSAAAPWTEEFRSCAAASADVVLFLHADDPDSVVEANPFLGCAILGPEASNYLDWAMAPALPGSPEDRLRALLARDGVNYASLAADLGRLERAASALNLAARLANQPRRLSVSLSAAPGSVPSLGCAWDGVEVAAVPVPTEPGARAEAPSRRGGRATVAAEALADELFTGVDAAPAAEAAAGAEAPEAAELPAAPAPQGPAGR